jgi:PPM family protein phosphatase
LADAPPSAAVGYGVSHPGLVRPKNEDRYLVDDDLGLYAVFDGMGGHSAGDVAAALARDVLVRYVVSRRHRRTPRRLLERGFQRASAAVHREAQRRRDRYGMGTTAVAVIVEPDRKAALASVGDSRVYLVRHGRLRLLTRDQTVVNELVAAGSLTPEAAENHPYRSVLSNNIGARARTHVQLAELSLEEGDRLLLCSDGLSGFAAPEAIAAIASGASDAERAAEDLVQLALDGGGGDNVTALVVEIGPKLLARSSMEVRRAASDALWQRRALFLEAVEARGLAGSPICASVSGDEAVDLVGGNLVEALARDLEQAETGHVSVFAEKLASGWMAKGGEHRPVQELLDALRSAALDVVGALRAARDPLTDDVEAGVYRSFASAEKAVGRLLAKRIRALETAIEEARRVRAQRELETFTISDQPTVPDAEGPVAEPADPDVRACLEAGLHTARTHLASEEERAALARAHALATGDETTSDRQALAYELCSGTLDEAAAIAVFAALDRARDAYIGALRRAAGEPAVRAAAMGRAALAHQGLAAAIAQLAIELGAPITDELAASAEHAESLRARVAQAEQRLSKLEDALAALAGQPIDTLVTEGGGA